MIELDLNDERAARALTRLRANADWLDFSAWLAAQQTALRKVNDSEENECLLRQRQGAIQALSVILEAAAKAPEIFETFRRNA